MFLYAGIARYFGLFRHFSYRKNLTNLFITPHVFALKSSKRGNSLIENESSCATTKIIIESTIAKVIFNEVKFFWFASVSIIMYHPFRQFCKSYSIQYNLPTRKMQETKYEL